MSSGASMLLNATEASQLFSSASLLFTPSNTDAKTVVSPANTTTSSSSCSPSQLALNKEGMSGNEQQQPAQQQQQMLESALNLSGCHKMVPSIGGHELQAAWLNLHQRTWQQMQQAQQQEAPPAATAAAVDAIGSAPELQPEQPKPEPEPEPEQDEPEAQTAAADLSMRSTSELSMSAPETSASPKSRRKSYHPQQIQAAPALEQQATGESAIEEGEPQAKRSRSGTPCANEEAVDAAASNTHAQRVQEVLQIQRQFYLDFVAQQQRKMMETEAGEGSAAKPMAPAAAAAAAVGDPGAATKLTSSAQKFHDETGKDIRSLGDNVKTELITQMNQTIDRLLTDFARDYQTRAALWLQEHIKQLQRNGPNAAANAFQAFNGLSRPPFYPPLFYGAQGGFPWQQQALSNGLLNSIFPAASAASVSSAPAMASSPGGLSSQTNNKDNAASPFARKKRSKVTDTRLSKLPVRSESQMEQQALALTTHDQSPKPSPLTSYLPPTMVGHGLFNVAQSPMMTSHASINSDDQLQDNELGLDDTAELNFNLADPSAKNSTQLSAMHLRKAKLMFFYTRYPSSSLLKTYFPDVQFNKNNTAQLVKWFSNFREFYYIQMEKFARHALTEGVRRADELTVSADCELYKVLIQHYNRNNHLQFQVPPAFRQVVEATLREFFLSIQAGKNAEPSWKKQIYKVIARLDDTIPEYFKNPKFLEQLE